VKTQELMRSSAALLMGLARMPWPRTLPPVSSASTGVHVVFENDHYFFAVKPPGMVCTGSEVGQPTFHDRVKAYAIDRYCYQPGLLHRLDRGTSGIMTYAKSLDAAKHYLALQERRGSITKEYVAVVHGAPPKPAGRIEGNICKAKDHRTYVVRGRKSDGKRVLTTYKLLATAHHPTLGEVSSLSMRLFSGRKHKIRASCRKLGCSIVGDEAYGGSRHHVMMLHARHVAFTGPDGAEVAVDAEPPPSWGEVYDDLLVHDNSS
jgi:23S rRNA pseudouridine1911/1915/1917 synthase